jgi:formylglycine-generating enzyme required for sulfatase activity
VWVPAGCFQMGSDPAKDKAAAKEEQPMHEVCITHGFWLDQFLVTNAAYDQFVKDGGYTKNEYWSPDGWKWLQTNRIKGPQNAAKFSDPNHPRIGVSWYEADAYARWRGGRLPTEAEWEYAARGPKSPIYPWGDTWDKTRANVNSAGVTVVVTYAQGKSWVGAFDMSGNVWQWVSDWYLDTYYEQMVKDDPQGPPGAGSHTLRGGAWDYTETYARSANRYDLAPDSRGFDIGFRVVTSAP